MVNSVGRRFRLPKRILPKVLRKIYKTRFAKVGDQLVEEADQREEITGTMEDFARAMELKIPEAEVAEDVARAREIAAATTDISQKMDLAMETVWQGMYNTLESIANWLTGSGLDEEQRGARDVAISSITKEIEAFDKEAQSQRAALVKAQTEMRTEKDETKKADLKKEVEGRSKSIKGLAEGRAVRQKTLEGIRTSQAQGK